MSQHASLLQYLALMSYVMMSSVILVLATAPMLAVATVLFLAPAILVWQQIDLKTRLIPLVALMTVAVTAVVQIYAYIHGLWYELAPSNTMVFGSGPIESYAFSVTFILYMIVMYEYFFDDKHSRVKTTYVARILALLGIILALSLGYVYFFAATVATSAYAVLVGAVMLSLVLMVGWRQSAVRIRILARAAVFSLTMLPVALVAELILLANNIRFFANPQDYVYSVPFFGYLVPIEEIALLFLLPIWVVVVYELLFDDGK